LRLDALAVMPLLPLKARRRSLHEMGNTREPYRSRWQLLEWRPRHRYGWLRVFVSRSSKSRRAFGGLSCTTASWREPMCLACCRSSAPKSARLICQMSRITSD
jgi:hypothetical protein